MTVSSIHKAIVLGLCVLGASLAAPAAWAQQSTKEPDQVSGADLQAWLSNGFVFAGEDHTNGSVFMVVGEASERTNFYSHPTTGIGTVKGTQRVDGNMFCTKWSFMAKEVCREWYRIGENKYEGRDKGSKTKSITLYIVSSRSPAYMKTGAMEVLGKKPGHIGRGPSSVAIDQAITKMIWAPGVDDGYVPQGVTWADGAVFLSAYRSTDPKVDLGPCRIFKIDPESGITLGQFDLPEDCGHAGGLAYAGKGILIAADTRRLYKINMAAAFAPGNPSNAVTATVALRGEVKGSFVDFDGSAVFVGSFEKDAAKAKGHFLPLSVFETDNGNTVDESAAVRSIPLPQEAQGAAFDKAGNLWITASSNRFGSLYRLDKETGRVAASYEMVIGIEDIAFDDQGRLWSVSEAGSLRWQWWSKTFPVLFRVDPGKLKENR